MKLAVIGCGNIARHHMMPMQNAGFEIFASAGRFGGSKSLDSFSSDFNVNYKYKDPFELLQSSEWDALLLACPTENMMEYINASINIDRPILIEKPITYQYTDLFPFIEKNNLCVGLNRRFYNTISMAKNFIEENEDILVRVTIPESLNELEENNHGSIPNKTYENSIHIFDILIYLLGQIEWLHSEKLYSNKNIKAITAIGSSDRCKIIQLNNYYNSSDNFSIEIISGNKRLSLKPIEISSLYEGISINEPSGEIPMRTYHPILKEKIIENNDLKPGFQNQAIAFMNFCKKKQVEIAKIKDLYNALKLIDNLN